MNSGVKWLTCVWLASCSAGLLHHVQRPPGLDQASLFAIHVIFEIRPLEHKRRVCVYESYLELMFT